MPECNTDIANRVQTLRKRCGLSIRQLAAQADVTPGMISCIERGKNSPSLTTLQKILSALGTTLGTFFSEETEPEVGPVIHRENMRLVRDGQRSYTMVFPKRDDIDVEMLDEQIQPAKTKPEFETLDCDVAGYVLAGSLVLEIPSESPKKRTIRTGDAFYIPKGTEHRGYAHGDDPARLITVYKPSRY